MCRDLIVILDCLCSNRAIEILEQVEKCDCCFFIEFKAFEVSFCDLCEKNIDDTISKIENLIRYYIGEEENVFYDEPIYCVEKVFR